MRRWLGGEGGLLLLMGEVRCFVIIQAGSRGSTTAFRVESVLVPTW